MTSSRPDRLLGQRISVATVDLVLCEQALDELAALALLLHQRGQPGWDAVYKACKARESLLRLPSPGRNAYTALCWVTCSQLLTSLPECVAKLVGGPDDETNKRVVQTTVLLTRAVSSKVHPHRGGDT